MSHPWYASVPALNGKRQTVYGSYLLRVALLLVEATKLPNQEHAWRYSRHEGHKTRVPPYLPGSPAAREYRSNANPHPQSLPSHTPTAGVKHPPRQPKIHLKQARLPFLDYQSVINTTEVAIVADRCKHKTPRKIVASTVNSRSKHPTASTPTFDRAQPPSQRVPQLP